MRQARQNEAAPEPPGYSCRAGTWGDRARLPLIPLAPLRIALEMDHLGRDTQAHCLARYAPTRSRQNNG